MIATHPLSLSFKCLFDNPCSLMKVSRKEVFQPHLPVRLPCYDLAPVISLALGRSCDGHELQALPTPMA